MYLIFIESISPNFFCRFKYPKIKCFGTTIDSHIRQNKWIGISLPICITVVEGLFLQVDVTWPSVIALPLQFTSRRQWVQSVLNSIISMIINLLSPKRCAVTCGNHEIQGGETIAIKSLLQSEVSKSVENYAQNGIRQIS